MPSNEESVSQWQIIITLAILGIIGVVGGIGNALVLVVYKKKLYNKHTADFFIIVLAISDLIVCLVIVPCTMAVEYLTFNISTFFCKGYYFLNISNLLFSTMLISAVALDRYLCICHPFVQYLTVGRSVKLVVFLAFISFTTGIMATFNVEVRVSADTTHDLSTSNTTEFSMSHYYSISSTKYVCDEIIHFNNVTRGQLVFYTIVEKINHTVFIASIISVIILYSFIFRVVVKIRHRDKLKEASIVNNSDLNNCQDSCNTLENSTITIDIKKIKPKPRNRTTKSKRSYNKLIMDINKTRKKSEKKQKNVSRQNLVSNETIQNMRSAAMLFVVALVYIIAFSPVLMIVSFKLFSFNLILYNLYYLNNAANPLIYCFMNSKFRKELGSVFCRRSYANNLDF